MIKPICKYLIIASFTLSSIGQASQPMDAARQIVGSSLAAAKEDATFLVMQDFERVLVSLAEQSQSNSTRITNVDELQLILNQLEREAENLASTKLENITLTRKNVEAFWEQYQVIVAKRYALSFEVQDRIRHSDMVFKALATALESFQAVCKSGRSEKGHDYLISPIPYSRGIDYQIHLGWDSSNDQSGFSAKIETSSANETSKNRAQVGQMLNTAASVSSSIAYSGGTGAAVAKAAAVNPYLLGAAIAYGVVSHALAAEEQAKLLNEIAEANNYMYQMTATEKEVARFYRESCQSIQPFVDRLITVVDNLQKNPESRSQMVKQAQATAEERQSFHRESDLVSTQREWLIVYSAAGSQKCLNQKHQEPEETAPCKLENGFFISTRNPAITIKANLETSKETSENYLQEIKKFGEKYPLEKKVTYTADLLIDSLAPEWERTESALMKFSFMSSDAVINSAFQKLLLILGQYRLELHKGWNTDADPIFAELQKTEKFRRLKAQYTQLVADGIKVMFNHLSRDEFRKNVNLFLLEAKPFIKKTYANNTIKNFESLVSNFERLYLKL